MIIICKVCGAEVLRKSNRQKYCSACWKAIRRRREAIRRASWTPEQKVRDAIRGKIKSKKYYATRTPQQVKSDRASCVRWCANRTPEQIQKTKKRKSDYIKQISPHYVRGLLAATSGLKRQDIPPDMVEAKRLQLKIKRYLKEHRE